MNGVHSQCLTDRQKDRGKDQARRCHVHKSTYDQQQDIDNKQDHVTVIADTKHSSTYCSGIPVNAMTQLIILDTPIRKMMIPVISALSRKIFGSSETLMER